MVNSLGQVSFDLTTTPRMPISLRRGIARSIIIEFSHDGNGAQSGNLFVYLQDAVGGTPWKTVPAGKYVSYPMPGGDFVTCVPSQGAQGLVTVSLSEEILAPGRF